MSRSADNSRLGHRRMRVQNSLHFRGVNIEAKSDNQILGASDNEKISILEAGQITGIEPSIRTDGSRCFFGRAIIPFHDVWSAHPQFAYFSFGEGLTITSNQSGFHAGKHRAHRVVLPRRDIKPYLGYVWRALGYAVTVMQRQAKQSFH